MVLFLADEATSYPISRQSSILVRKSLVNELEFDEGKGLEFYENEPKVSRNKQELMSQHTITA